MTQENFPQINPTEVPVQPEVKTEELTPEQRELSVKLLDEQEQIPF